MIKLNTFSNTINTLDIFKYITDYLYKIYYIIIHTWQWTTTFNNKTSNTNRNVFAIAAKLSLKYYYNITGYYHYNLIFFSIMDFIIEVCLIGQLKYVVWLEGKCKP